MKFVTDALLVANKEDQVGFENRNLFFNMRHSLGVEHW
jgi:hypothetical protein